jgi:hypothetical protein
MEPTNFNDTKIDCYFEQAVDYVCTLYDHHIKHVHLETVRIIITMKKALPGEIS